MVLTVVGRMQTVLTLMVATLALVKLDSLEMASLVMVYKPLLYNSDFNTFPSCTDIDECENSSIVCGLNATCTNNLGSYECSCDEGYRVDGISCVG